MFLRHVVAGLYYRNPSGWKCYHNQACLYICTVEDALRNKVITSGYPIHTQPRRIGLPPRGAAWLSVMI